MNKICKQYIKEIKAMFPIKSKKERAYIKNLSRDIDDYCVEENVTSKEQLYENYGNPIDVAREYLSAMGIDYVMKKIKIAKYIKALVSVLIAAVLVLTSTICIYTYSIYQMEKRQEVVITEEVIEEY